MEIKAKTFLGSKKGFTPVVEFWLSPSGVFRRQGRRSQNFTTGFTVIEILVAFTVFAFALAAITGILIESFRAQRQAAAFLNIQNNIRFSLELMAREMRTGSNFQALGAQLGFVNQRGENVRYRLNAGFLERSGDGGASFFPITASNVVVENWRFVLVGGAPSDSQQPRVTLSLRIRAAVGSAEIRTIIQTTVTQRELDS